MILTIRENSNTILSLSDDNKCISILKVSEDMKKVAELWVNRGLQYPISSNVRKVINPKSKTFLTDLQTYMKLNFPNLEYLME